MTAPEAATYLSVPVERVKVNEASEWISVQIEGTRWLAAPIAGIEALKEQMEGRDGSAA